MSVGGTTQTTLVGQAGNDTDDREWRRERERERTSVDGGDLGSRKQPGSASHCWDEKLKDNPQRSLMKGTWHVREPKQYRFELRTMRLNLTWNIAQDRWESVAVR